MNIPSPRKILSAKGYDFFTIYDRDAEVFEIFLDERGESYIGCADTPAEAKKIARDYADEQ